jgi:hypothetical protein
VSRETVQQTVGGGPVRRQAAGCWIPLLIAVLVLATPVYKGIRIWPHASALLTRARELRALVSADPSSLLHPQRLLWVREQLGATRSDLQAIRAEIGFLLPLAERLDWIPRFGGDIAATPALLDLGVELCDAGWWGLLGAEPMWDAVYNPNQPTGQSALEAVLPPLMAAQPRFSQAAQAVARARPAMARLQQLELSPRMASYVARFDAYWPVLEGAVLLAQDLPALLGQSRPMSYLLLAQNNHELRPTGGFISGVGLIQLSAGKIISTTFQDSYAVDALCDAAAHPPPPQPLREYMLAPELVFRDANWSPDFPASAATASSIYRLCGGVAVDGVVAMDLEAVSLLLGALGPLQPEGYPSPVTSDTLLQYVNDYWANPLRSVGTTDEQQHEWWLHRKDFMADLLKAALQKVTAGPQSLELTPLGVAVLKALQTRHLLVGLNDPAIGRGLSVPGWDGALRPTEGDYLMVVDANIGFRKVNPLVQQSVEYRVELDSHARENQTGQQTRATLTLRYTNGSQGSADCVVEPYLEDSYGQMMHGCYWDYVRVYVPSGSRLLAMQGGDADAQVSADAGKAVFSTLLVVAPGQTRELVLQYELPSSVWDAPRPGGGDTLAATEEGQAYSLLVQKQAGTVAVPYRVATSGPGWQFSRSRSAPVERYSGYEVTFSLATDTHLTWVDVTGRSRRATVPILALIGLGLVLLGLGVWVQEQSRVSTEV